MSLSSPRVKYDYYAAAALSLLAASIPAYAEESDKTLNTVVVTGNRGGQRPASGWYSLSVCTPRPHSPECPE